MKEHIIINNDRTIIVPASVYKIGNQYEHNVNKVTFDCPRYADDEQTIDLSSMKIYINYIRPDKEPLSSLAENVIVDETDPTIIHFDFRITRNVTFAKGVLSCLICIKSVNSEGIEEYHWNSDIFTKLTVGEGIENEEVISEENSDLITKLLLEVDTTKAEVNEFSDRIDSVDRKVGYLDLLSTEDKSSIVSAVNEVKEDSDELKGDIVNSKKAISELNDKKITKFYASNLGNTNLQDSDSGKITDMMLYGKSEQKSYIGKNLLKSTLVTTTANGVTCTNNGDGTYTLNGTATDQTDFHIITSLPKESNKYKIIGCPSGGGSSNYKIILVDDIYWERQIDIGNGVIYNGEYNLIRLSIRIANGTNLKNIVFKPMIVDVSLYPDATYDDFEPYTGGIPSPNPDYPQEIKSVVNPTVKVSNKDGTKSQTVTLPYTLNAIPVSSGGNVTIDGQQYIADYVDIENKKLVRNVRKTTLTSLSSLPNKIQGTNGEYHYSFGYNMYDASKTLFNIMNSAYVYLMCENTRIVPQSSELAYNENVMSAYGHIYNFEIRVRPLVDNYPTLEELNAYLTSTVVIYPIEPIITDITDEEVQEFIELATYYHTTNVIVTSDQLDGYTEFNYPLNMKNGWDYVKEQLGDTREYIYDMDLQSAEAYVNSEYAVTLTELEV